MDSEALRTIARRMFEADGAQAWLLAYCELADALGLEIDPISGEWRKKNG